MIETPPHIIDPKQLSDDCLPLDFHIQILKTFDTLYRDCHQHCRPPKFETDAAKTTVVQMIHGRVQTALFDIANSFSNMKSERRKTKKNGATYTHIEAESSNGERIILTASSAHTPKEKPRAAAHRSMLNTNRRLNGQCELFETSSVNENAIYAVLLYGSPQASIPGFINIAFPNEGWTEYVFSIPLMKHFPGIIGNPIPEENDITPKYPQPVRMVPEEEIKKEQSPRIRPRRKAVGDE